MKEDRFLNQDCITIASACIVNVKAECVPNNLLMLLTLSFCLRHQSSGILYGAQVSTLPAWHSEKKCRRVCCCKQTVAVAVHGKNLAVAVAAQAVSAVNKKNFDSSQFSSISTY